MTEKDGELGWEPLSSGRRGGILSGLGIFVASATAAVAALLFFTELHLRVESIFECSLSFFLLFFAACVMYFSLWDVGAQRGGETEEFQRTREEFARLAEEVENGESEERLEDFLETVSEREAEREVRRLLRRAGLTEGDLARAREEGIPKTLPRARRRTLRRALRVRPLPLGAGTVLSRSGGRSGRLLAPSPTGTRAVRSLAALVPAALTACFSVGVVFEWLASPDMGTLLLCLCKLFTLLWNGVKGYRGGSRHKTRDEAEYDACRARLLRAFLAAEKSGSLKNPK